MQRERRSTRPKARSRYGIAALAALVVALFALMAAPGSALAATGTIKGQVTNTFGEPVFFAEVCAVNPSTELAEVCDNTGFSEQYELTVEEGEYKVSFEASEYQEQWYNDKPDFGSADVVNVSGGGTVENVNAEMVSEWGRISGKTTDARNGSGIGGLEVCVIPTSEEFGYDCEETEPDGSYEFQFVSPGSYKLVFYSRFKYNESLEKEELEGPNYVYQWYSGKAHEEEAGSVSVSEGQTTTANASMQPGASITGTVTDAVTHATIQDMEVCAWNEAWGYECNYTDKNGNYAIQTVPTGSYKVEFQPYYFYIKEEQSGKEYWKRSDYVQMEYLRQYYSDKFSFATATPVAATGGATVSGINAAMTKEFEAPAPPPPGVAKVGKTAKVKGGKALLKLKCGGPGTCSGVIKLSAKPTPAKKKGGKKHKKGAKTVLIGKAKFSIAAGKSATVRVKLNGKGKQLIARAGKKGLKATVSGTGVAKSKVTLKGPAPKKKGKKKGHH
jgi:hypothetical protein